MWWRNTATCNMLISERWQVIDTSEWIDQSMVASKKLCLKNGYNQCRQNSCRQNSCNALHYWLVPRVIVLRELCCAPDSEGMGVINVVVQNLLQWAPVWENYRMQSGWVVLQEDLRKGAQILCCKGRSTKYCVRARTGHLEAGPWGWDWITLGGVAWCR